VSSFGSPLLICLTSEYSWSTVDLNIEVCPIGTMLVLPVYWLTVRRILPTYHYVEMIYPHVHLLGTASNRLNECYYCKLNKNHVEFGNFPYGFWRPSLSAVVIIKAWINIFIKKV
jgi:hypothetical protein